jgi:hypothetical protein
VYEISGRERIQCKTIDICVQNLFLSPQLAADFTHRKAPKVNLRVPGQMIHQFV